MLQQCLLAEKGVLGSYKVSKEKIPEYFGSWSSTCPGSERPEYQFTSLIP